VKGIIEIFVTVSGAAYKLLVGLESDFCLMKLQTIFSKTMSSIHYNSDSRLKFTALPTPGLH